MKAVFKGYKKFGSYKFTAGKIYELEYCSTHACYITRDDVLSLCTFENGDIYDFVTETEREVVSSGVDKNPGLRYYINGHEVDVIEFRNVYRTVYELYLDGIKCDTIKLEVKFE